MSAEGTVHILTWNPQQVMAQRGGDSPGVPLGSLGSAPWGSPKPLGRGAGLAIPSHLPCAVIPSRQAFLLAVAAGTLLTTPQHTAIGAHPVSVPTYRAQGTPTYSYVPPHW